jgi:glycerol uptake facilitator-like aquaporin
MAEALGTALLLIAVVGSGIMADRLSGGNAGLALLANAVATGCALYGLITVLGPVSGAHFNPAVTAAMWFTQQIPLSPAAFYIIAQIVGAVLGVLTAHLMFGLPLLQISDTARTGTGQWVSEGVATFGLLFIIFGARAAAPSQVAGVVAVWITGAYWFTSSTSFANPAVTLARTLTDTFAGIAPSDAPAFVAVQLATAVAAAFLLPRLFSR